MAPMISVSDIPIHIFLYVPSLWSGVNLFGFTSPQTWAELPFRSKEIHTYTNTSNDSKNQLTLPHWWSCQRALGVQYASADGLDISRRDSTCLTGDWQTGFFKMQRRQRWNWKEEPKISRLYGFSRQEVERSTDH